MTDIMRVSIPQRFETRDVTDRPVRTALRTVLERTWPDKDFSELEYDTLTHRHTVDGVGYHYQPWQAKLMLENVEVTHIRTRDL